jgi:hypothetical protein
MGPTALLPSKAKRAADFYRPYKSIASSGFEPANLESNGMRAKYYTAVETTLV